MGGLENLVTEWSLTTTTVTTAAAAATATTPTPRGMGAVGGTFGLNVAVRQGREGWMGCAREKQPNGLPPIVPNWSGTL